MLIASAKISECEGSIMFIASVKILGREGRILLLAGLKFRSARGASHHPVIIDNCQTISNTSPHSLT